MACITIVRVHTAAVVCVSAAWWEGIYEVSHTTHTPRAT